MFSKKAIAVSLMSASLFVCSLGSAYATESGSQKLALQKKSSFGVRFHEHNCFEVGDEHFKERIGLTEHELISLIGVPELSQGDYWSYVNYWGDKTKHCKITYHFVMKNKVKEVKEVFVTTSN